MFVVVNASQHLPRNGFQGEDVHPVETVGEKQQYPNVLHHLEPALSVDDISNSQQFWSSFLAHGQMAFLS